MALEVQLLHLECITTQDSFTDEAILQVALNGVIKDSKGPRNMKKSGSNKNWFLSHSKFAPDKYPFTTSVTFCLYDEDVTTDQFLGSETILATDFAPSASGQEHVCVFKKAGASYKLFVRLNPIDVPSLEDIAESKAGAVGPNVPEPADWDDEPLQRLLESWYANTQITPMFRDLGEPVWTDLRTDKHKIAFLEQMKDRLRFKVSIVEGLPVVDPDGAYQIRQRNLPFSAAAGIEFLLASTNPIRFAQCMVKIYDVGEFFGRTRMVSVDSGHKWVGRPIYGADPGLKDKAKTIGVGDATWLAFVGKQNELDADLKWNIGFDDTPIALVDWLFQISIEADEEHFFWPLSELFDTDSTNLWPNEVQALMEQVLLLGSTSDIWGTTSSFSFICNVANKAIGDGGVALLQVAQDLNEVMSPNIPLGRSLTNEHYIVLMKPIVENSDGTFNLRYYSNGEFERFPDNVAAQDMETMVTGLVIGKP